MGVNKKGGLVGGFDQLRAPNAPTISVSVGNASVTVTITNPSDVGGGDITGYAVSALTGPIEDTTFAVTVVSSGGNKYAIDGSFPTRGLFMGGSNGAGSYYNTIQYIDISTTGNTTDFGDLSADKEVWDGVAGNATRSIAFGGLTSTGATNVIEYVNPTSAGNATDFGDMPVTDNNVALAALANNTRAVYQRKEGVTIEYVTIASTGNPSDFGDAVVSRRNGAAGFASTTRGCIAGGMDASSGTLRNQIDYITIGSAGNATDFGDLTAARYGPTGCSNATRGLILGGETGSGFSDVIDYVTIASTGNATDFGDLLAGVQAGTACASTTRAVKGGGSISGGTQDVMQYITIASTGDATDFGDLAANTYRFGATSVGHGGLS